jgi:hypothetical protein
MKRHRGSVSRVYGNGPPRRKEAPDNRKCSKRGCYRLPYSGDRCRKHRRKAKRVKRERPDGVAADSTGEVKMDDANNDLRAENGVDSGANADSDGDAGHELAGDTALQIPPYSPDNRMQPHPALALERTGTLPAEFTSWFGRIRGNVTQPTVGQRMVSHAWLAPRTRLLFLRDVDNEHVSNH